MKIVGRIREQEILHSCLESGRPEFIAVYGRRRVGKTFLLRESLKDHIVFTLSGASHASTREQLNNFDEALEDWGGKPRDRARDWQQAFRLLKEYVKGIRHKRRKVVFFDEVPWLATQRSGFISALGYFWNSFASTREDVILVICGSASSWIIDNVINDRGGLHNRITRQIWLEPFTLGECESYYRERGIELSRYQIAQLYMVIGGIPYYMDYVEKGSSPEQVVDSLFFAKGAPLANEFDNLYASLFKNSERHLRIVRELGHQRHGLTQAELLSAMKVKPGGNFSKALVELEQCGFVRRYRDFTKPKRGQLYQLVDFFTLFYFKHMENTPLPNARYWQNQSGRGGWNAWNGLAFERVCTAHSEQVLMALGISGVATTVMGWQSTDASPGVQVDQLIQRADGIVDLCEAKFTARPFAVSAEYDAKLLYRRETFREETGTKLAVHVVMISASGLTPGSYRGTIQNLVTLDDLFR